MGQASSSEGMNLNEERKKELSLRLLPAVVVETFKDHRRKLYIRARLKVNRPSFILVGNFLTGAYPSDNLYSGKPT